ncbi:MAG: NUDIX domain-containing protein, partial [Pseudomonadota bacterium]
VRNQARSVSLKLRYSGADVRIVADDVVFDGYFRVHQRTFEHRLFSGDWSPPIVREVFERGSAVGVLPYDPWDDSLILIEQFRAGSVGDAVSPWMLELIAGIVELGEEDEAVARREAVEEAGCDLDLLTPIASFYPSAGACSEHVRLFLGRVRSAAVGEVKGLADEGEDILVHRVPRVQALAMLESDSVNNGHTLVALQWFALNWKRQREQWLAN